MRKYRPDAFYATPLDTLMRWNGMKPLVIVGIGAEVGVVPTLMSASNLGYRRVAISDALGPSNPSRMDDAMLYIADYATVKTAAEVIDIWRGHIRAALVVRGAAWSDGAAVRVRM